MLNWRRLWGHLLTVRHEMLRLVDVDHVHRNSVFSCLSLSFLCGMAIDSTLMAKWYAFRTRIPSSNYCSDRLVLHAKEYNRAWGLNSREAIGQILKVIGHYTLLSPSPELRFILPSHVKLSPHPLASGLHGPSNNSPLHLARFPSRSLHSTEILFVLINDFRLPIF